MFRRVFVDIDTQYDFVIPGGALYIPGAEAIVPNVMRLFRFARRERIPILSSADWHSADDPEFAVWPPHCVRGTPGQAKLPETLLPNRTTLPVTEIVEEPERLFDRYDQVVFNKMAIDVWTNPNAARLVENLEVGEYVVFGVATDYCVSTATLGLLRRGRRTAVVSDAVCAVAEQTGKTALDEMASGGAHFVTTDEVVGAVR